MNRHLLPNTALTGSRRATAMTTNTQTSTMTLTEQQINDDFPVMNLFRYHISDIYVDLLPGQIAISYFTNPNEHRNAKIQPSAVRAVFVPRIYTGRLFWNVISVSANGGNASEMLIEQFYQQVLCLWHYFVRSQIGPERISAITITHTEMKVKLQ